MRGKQVAKGRLLSSSDWPPRETTGRLLHRKYGPAFPAVSSGEHTGAFVPLPRPGTPVAYRQCSAHPSPWKTRESVVPLQAFWAGYRLNHRFSFSAQGLTQRSDNELE